MPDDEDDSLDWEIIEQIRDIGRNLGNGLLSKVIGRLVETLPQRIAELRGLAESQQHEQLRRLAHGLKGTAGNAGARALADRLRALEQSIDEGQGQLDDLLTAVEQESRRLEPVLRRLLEEESE